MSIPPILEPGPEALKRAAQHLRDGEIVVCSSDANYGIAADPFDADAIAACFDIKRRAGAKPLTLFIDDPRTGDVSAPPGMSIWRQNWSISIGRVR